MDLHEIKRRIELLRCEPAEGAIAELATLLDALVDNVLRIDSAARAAANTASCLANGIVPD